MTRQIFQRHIPSTDSSHLPSRRTGRTPSITAHHWPRESSTRSACPVFCTSSSTPFRQRGLLGPSSHGPMGPISLRLTHSQWPLSVPPSAVKRYQYRPRRKICDPSATPDEDLRISLGSDVDLPVSKSTVHIWMAKSFNLGPGVGSSFR